MPCGSAASPIVVMISAFCLPSIEGFAMAETTEIPQLTGAETIAASLRKYGVSTVFSLAGGAHTYLLDAVDRAGIKIIGGRHETATVGAADGYARVTNTLGVACIIEDQGVPSAIAGLASAFHAGTPVVVLNSRLPSGWHDAGTPYDNDKQSMFAAVTKWSRVVPSAARLAEFVDAACRQALSGRPGPVVLTIPRDFYTVKTPRDALLDWPRLDAARPTPNVTDLAAFVTAFTAAKRPLILAGAGVRRSGAVAALRALSAAFNIPVLGKAEGRGVVGEDDARGFAYGYAVPALAEADFVVVLGARLLTHENFGLPPLFAPDAIFARVDISPEELNRARPNTYAFAADAKAFIEAWHEALQQRGFERLPPRAWIHDALAERRASTAALDSDTAGKLHPHQIVAVTNALAPKNTVFVVDGGYPNAWVSLALKVAAEGRFLDLHPLGQMGTGTPLAIGAAAASGAPVILLTGDGSLGYYATSLSEAVRAGLKLIVIVFNDAAWGSEYNSQIHDKIGRDINTRLGALDFGMIGRGLGLRGVRVTALEEFRTALTEALAAPQATVIDAAIDVADALVLHRDAGLRTIGFNEWTPERRRLVKRPKKDREPAAR